MEFDKFTMLVRDEVQEMAGRSCKVQIKDVKKNNGVVLRGLTVMQDSSNVSPTIYLNSYYEAYIEGRAALLDVVNDVMDTYQRNKVNQSVDMRYFLDYERVRDSVVYKLINTEKNKELLEDVPHIEFHDLSIVFQCMVESDDIGSASILIHNIHMNLWGVSTELLYQAAKENTQRIQKYEIKNMSKVLCEIATAENPEECDKDNEEAFSGSFPMYVLSNQRRVDGAACMLYPNLISDFADAAGSSLFIIPSSIHEVLILPTAHADESTEIKNMIKEINDTQVSAEEILSYSLYFYDRNERKIIRL